jgi:hypothetical protein
MIREFLMEYSTGLKVLFALWFSTSLFKNLFTPVLNECSSVEASARFRKESRKKSFVMTLRYELSSINCTHTICNENVRILSSDSLKTVNN